ncbi:hypothetical protein CSKR_110441, partial [Clonorchis sinensis]
MAHCSYECVKLMIRCASAIQDVTAFTKISGRKALFAATGDSTCPTHEQTTAALGLRHTLRLRSSLLMSVFHMAFHLVSGQGISRIDSVNSIRLEESLYLLKTSLITGLSCVRYYVCPSLTNIRLLAPPSVLNNAGSLTHCSSNICMLMPIYSSFQSRCVPNIFRTEFCQTLKVTHASSHRLLELFVYYLDQIGLHGKRLVSVYWKECPQSNTHRQHQYESLYDITGPITAASELNRNSCEVSARSNGVLY